MSKINRREFIRLAGGVGAAVTLSMFGHSQTARAAKGGQVVIIGGGFGGATAAKYIRRADKGITVTLVEPNRQFVTCPFSNMVLGGLREMPSITHD